MFLKKEMYVFFSSSYKHNLSAHYKFYSNAFESIENNFQLIFYCPDRTVNAPVLSTHYHLIT